MNPTIYIPIINEKAFVNRKAKNKDASSTKRTLIKTILAILKFTNIKHENKEVFCTWYKEFVRITKILEDQQDNNVQKESSLTWTDVVSQYEKMPKGSLKRLTLGIYTLIPPRRQFDYWKLRINGEIIPGDTGKINFDNKTIEVYVYKTKDKYDVWKKDLPNLLIDDMKGYLETVKDNREYLFTKDNGLPYKTLYSFTSANNKIIKEAMNNKNVSVNSIRHAAASFVNTDKYMTRKDKKQYAYDMGHSFAMQTMYVEALAD
jgi:integrase